MNLRKFIKDTKHLTNKMKKYNLILLIISITVMSLLISYIAGRESGIDRRTIELCKEWARSDHRKTIGYERYEKMNHLWEGFDWYESCINQR